MIRLALVPFLLTFYIGNQLAAATFLLFIAFATDLLDGRLCRRHNLVASNPHERYLDSLVDFALVISMFTAFAIRNLYPIWIPVLIALVFLQFVATSGLRRPLYDPVGKYLGVFLFGIIGATMLMPRFSGELMLVALGFMAISVACRMRYISHR